MQNRILDVNGDIIETTHYDEMTGGLVVKKTQDTQAYLDQNQRERSMQTSGWKGDLHKVASIPVVLIEEWCKKHNCNILEKQNRHLLMLEINSRDNRKLRTKEGRV